VFNPRNCSDDGRTSRWPWSRILQLFDSTRRRVATSDAAFPAEQIVTHAAHRGPAWASPLLIWMVGYHYLCRCGRLRGIRNGQTAPRERLDDVRTVVDFLAPPRAGPTAATALLYYMTPPVHQPLLAGRRRRRAGQAPRAPRSRWTRPRPKPQAAQRHRRGYSLPVTYCDSRVGASLRLRPLPPTARRPHNQRARLPLAGPPAPGATPGPKADPPMRCLTMTLTFDPTLFTSLEITDLGHHIPRARQLLTAVHRAAWWGTACYADRAPLPPQAGASVTHHGDQS